MKRMARDDSFIGRGGGWVLAQALILLLAAAIPAITGTAGIRPIYLAQWIGVVLTAAGLVLSVAALASLGSAMTPFPRPRADGALRTTGLYAWARHPVYTGMIIGTLGWALWWLSLPGVVFTLAVFVFLDRKATREEVWLCEKFDAYSGYRERVAKLIPLLY